MSAESARTAALAVMAVGQTAFVALYLTWPWWSNFLGRSLFIKAVSLAALLDTYMVYRIFDLPHADWVFTVLYCLLAIGIWAQFFAFLKVALEHRQAEVSGNDSPDENY